MSLILLSLAGCHARQATPAASRFTLSTPDPIYSAKLQGNVEVKKFIYHPGEKEKDLTIIVSKHIATGSKGYYTNNLIDQYFGELLKLHLTKAGAKTEKEKCSIKGDILEYRFNDHPFLYVETFYAKVHYFLVDGNGKNIYEKISKNRLNTQNSDLGENYSPTQSGLFEQVLADNIQALVTDSNFGRTLKKYCNG